MRAIEKLRGTLKRLARDSSESARGSIGAVFAVLLASGVLIGLVALAVDTGIAYQEQQTLRIASTAASKGLAGKCATYEPQCVNQVAATALVQQILDANSADGVTAIEEICGTSPLNACLPLTDRTQDCGPVEPGVTFARVTAKTQTTSGSTIGTIFAQLLSGSGQPALETQLWSCSQAMWETINTTSAEIEFNVIMPSCDYPGSTTPFVSFEFIDQGNNPVLPRTTSCSLQVEGDGPVETLTDVMNGFAPFEAEVGSCNTAVTIALESQVFDNGNSKKFCGGSVGSIGTWIDGKIANDSGVQVALGGAINSPQANHWYIDVIGFAEYKFLGYRISNSVQGGMAPPGGWSNYPAGVENAAKCRSNNPCFYGYYTEGPTFLTDPVIVRIIP